MTYKFDTDVQRLLNLIVYSLYNNRDIFMRELISNASDAIHKSATKRPQIKVYVDTDNRTITIADNGVGMTFDSMKENLGTIAKSDTRNFAKAAEKQTDLIGSFGVGFYSAYLVSSTVTVISASYNPMKQLQYSLWTSRNQTTYDIETLTLKQFKDRVSKINNQFTDNMSFDPNAPQTYVTLDVRQDCSQYLQPMEIYTLIKKHSDFIQYPIYIMKRGAAEEKVNSQIPLWHKEASEEEYKNFYQQLACDRQGFLKKIHIVGDGFRALLFIPKPQTFSFDQQPKSTIKLYSKRVFVTDELGEALLPEYLWMVKGIVDSDNVSLNISRETLQDNGALKGIRKQILKKVLQDLKSMMGQPEYLEFYKGYSKNLKLGICHDKSNRKELLDLLVFESSNQKQTSLKQYVEAMLSQQKEIYFIAAQGITQCRNSPFIDGIVSHGYDVVYMTEPIDEHMMQVVRDYEGRSFIDCSRECVDEFLSAEEKKNMIDLCKEKRQFLCQALLSLQKTYPDVESVMFGSRTGCSPGVVVSSLYAWSVNMERIMTQQVMGDSQMFDGMKSKKHLELNCKHELVQRLMRQPDEQLLLFLFRSILVQCGYEVDDISAYISEVYDRLSKTL